MMAILHLCTRMHSVSIESEAGTPPKGRGLVILVQTPAPTPAFECFHVNP